MPATSFYGGEYFGGEFFNTATPATSTKTGTGGIDPGGKRRSGKKGIFKPTGLVGKPKAKTPKVQQRLDETREIHEEVKEQAKKEFLGEQLSPAVMETLLMAETEAEMKALLRKKLMAENEEALLIILLASQQ